MTIGDNIKKFRKENNLTQKELAYKSSLSRSYLADLERDRYNPSLDSLKLIADSLGVSVSVLLDEDGNLELSIEKDETELKHSYTIGQNIKNIRKSKGFSMDKIKEITGLSKSTISDLENDKSSPTVETLEKIANALEVPIETFFRLNQLTEEKNYDKDLYMIAKIREKMTDKDKEKMMRILEACFDEYFDN